MFVRISPLLDVLHCYFLHGAPWHDVLFLYASVREKNRNPCWVLRAFKPGWESLPPRRLSCHPRRSNPWTAGHDKAAFRETVYVKFPAQHSAAEEPEVSHSVPSPGPVTLTAPTKLPAYPSSPTPIWATGTVHYARRTNPPASQRTTGGLRDHRARIKSIHLKVYER